MDKIEKKKPRVVEVKEGQTHIIIQKGNKLFLHKLTFDNKLPKSAVEQN